MAETPTMQVWIGRVIFLLLCFVIIFFQLLPLDTRPQTLPWPDFLFAVTLVWVARRPDFAPFYVIGFVFLVTDIFYQRPPGLWAAIILIFTEVIRTRALRIRNMPLMLEWGSIAVGIVAVTLLYRLVLAMTLLPQAPLGMTLFQMMMTIIAYPIVALIARYLFGVARPTLGAVDSLGHRL